MRQHEQCVSKSSWPQGPERLCSRQPWAQTALLGFDKLLQSAGRTPCGGHMPWQPQPLADWLEPRSPAAVVLLQQSQVQQEPRPTPEGKYQLVAGLSCWCHEATVAAADPVSPSQGGAPLFQPIRKSDLAGRGAVGSSHHLQGTSLRGTFARPRSHRNGGTKHPGLHPECPNERVVRQQKWQVPCAPGQPVWLPRRPAHPSSPLTVKWLDPQW